MTFLAHGALGNWDELIFAGVAIIFVIIMAMSWFRSINMEDDIDPTPDENNNSDRFTLD